MSVLPLWPILIRGDAPTGYRVFLAALWVATAFLRSRVFVMVAALPLGLLWAKTFGVANTTFVADGMTFAVASGGAISMALRRNASRSILGLPALVLGAAIVTSAFVELWAVRAVAPMRPFFTDLWYHVRVLYWTEDAGNWLMVHDAVRWVAVLVTAVVVERSLRVRRADARLTTWVWLGASAAATSFTAVRVGEIIARRETGILESIGWIFSNVRLSVLHPDPNAAGSILAWLVAAGVIIGLRRRLPWVLTLIVLPLVATFALAQSRAAVGALVAALLARWLIPRIRMTRGFAWTATVAVAIFAVVAIWMVYSRSHVAPARALELRVQMLEVGLNMAARFPVFGVGLGDYARTSRRFIPADLKELAVFARAGENAHNNYLQVLVELGPLAFVAFLSLVLPAVVMLWRRSPSHLEPESDGLVVGLSAFLLSALFGHPLLIPEVQVMFAIGLALTAAAVTASERPPRWIRAVAWAATAFFAVSLLWRLT